MATKKSSTSSSSSSSSKKTSTKKSSTVSLNKISFYTICAVAILYLVGMILSLCNANLKIVSALQGLATAIMICIVGILAWRYVRNRPTVWKVLYIVCLLVVIVGIIIPLIK